MNSVREWSDFVSDRKEFLNQDYDQLMDEDFGYEMNLFDMGLPVERGMRVGGRQGVSEVSDEEFLDWLLEMEENQQEGHFEENQPQFGGDW